MGEVDQVQRPRVNLAVVIRTLWAEIDRWFEDHRATKNLAARRPPVTRAMLARLEKTIGARVPADLRESLEVHDGGGSFESYRLLSAERICEQWISLTELRRDGAITKRLWNEAWIPFAQDGGGNLKAVDPQKERLLSIELQGPQGVFATRRRTFTDFLKAYAAKLAQGKLVVDEEGFVDELHPPRPVHPDEVGPALDGVIGAAQFADDVATIRSLLDTGVIRPDSRTAFQSPILTGAAQRGGARIVTLLIERGANVNIDAGHGSRNPLIACCYSATPRLDIIEKLLAAGADPNTRVDDRDDNALAVAEMYRQPALIALLGSYGATTVPPGAKKPAAKRPAATRTVKSTVKKPVGKARRERR